MNRITLALVALSITMPLTQAKIKHIEMRVEGMT
jgi:hypothetical protein